MIRGILLAAVPILAGWTSVANGAVAVADRNRLWSDHVIPFVICETLESADKASQPIDEITAATRGCDHGGRPLATKEATKVRLAIKQWNEQFGSELAFVQVDELRRSWRGLLFSRSDQETICSTDRIGRPKISRRTNLKVGTRCNGFAASETPVGTILHEMMHVAGFYHEQQRPDRDAYLRLRAPHGLVSVLFDVGGATQWAKGDRYSMRLLSSYDFRSIMHYPVCDPKRAILTLEGLQRLKQQGASITDPGRRDAMSPEDIAAVIQLYGKQAGQSYAKGKSIADGQLLP